MGGMIRHNEINAASAATLQVGLVRDRSAGLLWALLAAVPALMALTTWAPDGAVSGRLMVTRFHAPQALAIELLVCVLAWCNGFRPIAALRSLPRARRLPLLLLIAGALFGASVIAPDLSGGMMRSMISLLHLLFGLSVFHLTCLWRPAGLFGLWRLLTLGALAYVLLLILYVFSIDDPVEYPWKHLGLGVVNVRHAGFFLAIGAAGGLTATALESDRRWQAIGLAIATLCLAACFWSGSRGSVLALLAMIGSGMLLYPRLRHLRFPGASAIALVGGALLSLCHVPPDSHFGLLRILFSAEGSGADAISSGRLTLWNAALRKGMEHPLTGFGEGQFHALIPEAQRSGVHHPHNIVVQIFFQWGLIGLVCCAALGAGLWLRLHKATRQAPELLPGMLVVNMLLFYALYDGVFFFAYPVMALAFVSATMAGWVAAQAGAKAPLSSSST